MVSSALYRYFPSRDELLTALIIDAYDSLGAAAEDTDRTALEAGAPPRARWIAVCEAVRGWALAHPHEYALVYGSPVPGYSAPQDTIGPASRVANTLIGILRSAHAGHGLALPSLPAGLRREAGRMTSEFAEGLPPEVTAALVAAWAQLVGLVSCELFGQYERVVEERGAFFAHAAGQLAHGVGLPAL